MGTLADKALRKKRHDAHVALCAYYFIFRRTL